VETEILEYDRYNIAKFRRAAGALLEKKPDGVILSPVMPERIKDLITRIQDGGTPCVFFDANLPGARPLCAIGQDAFRGGYLAGRLMHLLAGNLAKPVAVLDAHGEDYHIIRRRDGFLRYAGEQGFSTVVREYSGYRGAELPAGEIASFLADNPDLAGVFITNSMAHRVAEAAGNRAKAPGRFILVGYDLIPKNRELLRDGAIDAIISQRPEEQGRQALLNLYRSVVLEQPVQARIEMPLDVFFRENIPS
jgi:LacI family transcriptional regulator